MNDQITKKSAWLTQVKEMLSKHSSGRFAAKDEVGAPVVLEWRVTDILSPDLASFKKDVADIAAQTTATMEVEFLHKHPEAASSEFLLKPCEPLLKNGLAQVDWQQVEQTIRSTIKQFYLTDISAFGDVIKPLLEDLYGFVVIKNQGTKTILGFMMFSITPALADGNVKVMHVSVAQTEELQACKPRGLDKLLMCSIFKILPGTKRIFIGTRPTHEQGIKTYRSWGFSQDTEFTQDAGHKLNLEYFAVYEYLADKADLLQKTATTLIDVR